MHRISFLLTLFALLFTFPSLAQKESTFEINLLTGANVGWWGHNLGLDENGEHIGWNRSHTSPEIPFEVQAWWNASDKISLGISLDYSLFMDDYMVGSKYTRQKTERIQFSDKEYITTWSAKVNFRYSLLSNEKFKLGPLVGIGYGNTISTHPDQNRFKKNLAYTVSFFTNWYFHKNVGLSFQPNYDVLQIFPEDRKPEEQHKLSFFGIKLGLVWRL